LRVEWCDPPSLIAQVQRSRFPHARKPAYPLGMCRNIKTLHNFAPPATEEEVRASALQYVRKLSGTTRPSQVNAQAFERAVDEVHRATRRLLDELVTQAAPRSREAEAAKAKARGRRREAQLRKRYGATSEA